jgi:hypothetical protein
MRADVTDGLLELTSEKLFPPPVEAGNAENRENLRQFKIWWHNKIG